jgi:Ferritin-like domain
MRISRREFVVAGAASLVVPATASAQGSDDRGKAALIAVLRLEQTALVAYEAIANAGVLTDTLRLFLEHERQHADQLVAAIENVGAKPPIPPSRGDIRGLEAAQRSRSAAARFAIALELRTVAAYQGAIRDSADSNVVRTSAGAMGTDAQQLVVLREAAGLDPVPLAFETGRPA